MRYFNPQDKIKTPWKDIAKKFNLSITRVISLHEQGKKILLKKFNIKNKINSL